mmetsp:Transcript_4098/g.11535  ORF Transcript_4098/g.11535 Transcript_4098/m.11535 type:complete len:110 (+) Transcript_4098:85-414(+)
MRVVVCHRVPPSHKKNQKRMGSTQMPQVSYGATRCVCTCSGAHKMAEGYICERKLGRPSYALQVFQDGLTYSHWIGQSPDNFCTAHAQRRKLAPQHGFRVWVATLLRLA